MRRIHPLIVRCLCVLGMVLGVCVALPAVSASAQTPTSYVTGVSLGGSQRNDVSTWVGMRFSTATPLTVSQLGRYFITGNTQSHEVKLVSAASGADVVGTTVSVDMSAGSADTFGFKYAALASPVTLPAGTYYLVSQEFSGGDEFYDASGTTVTTTGIGTELGSVYGITTWTPNGSAGQSYGPVNFQYTLAGTYYVDNGTGCSDANAGTSPTAAWCDFANVDATTFAPGARILLKRGDTWNVSTSTDNQLRLTGSGTAAAPILLDAYGSGSRPVIRGDGNGADRLAFMTDVDYWTVQNLELAYAGEGLVVTYTTPDHYGLTFSNIYAHDLAACVQGVGTGCSGVYWSTSIAITSPFALASGQWVLDGVTISGMETDNATAPSLYADCGTGEACNPDSYQDVVIKGNYFHDSNGGISLQGVSKATVISNNITDQGLDAKTSGQTALFLLHTSDILIADNVFSDEHDTGSPDETGIDVEGYDDQVKIRGNYFSDNAGSGIEYLALSSRSGTYNTNNEATANTFYNDGTAKSSPSIEVMNQTGEVMTGTLSDNLYYETQGFISGLPANWTNTDELAVAASDMFTSVGDFGASQPLGGWSNRYYSGGTWQDFTDFDSTLNRWYQGSAYVSQFDMSPDDNNTWVARRWTAPRSGTIQIRGVLLKYVTGGDGVTALIAKNGTGIWPAGGGRYSLGADDQVGTSTDVSDLTVAAGDTIDFEVGNTTGDATDDDTAWIPTIAYTQ